MANTPVNETLRAALKRLEAANEGVSACRSGTTYLRMIEDPGALDALAELDSARRVARTALASSMEHSLDAQGRIGCVSCANEIAAAIRALPSSSPEDQQKAAATPTIADPDGETRS